VSWIRLSGEISKHGSVGFVCRLRGVKFRLKIKRNISTTILDRIGMGMVEVYDGGNAEAETHLKNVIINVNNK
jgi:hypothetical protein